MRWLAWVGAVTAFLGPSASFAEDSLSASLSYFRTKIKIESADGVPDVNKYMTASPGFAGTRNVRVVLPGLVYRGGADNRRTPGPKPNMNPLPEAGQENLCRQRFGQAFYLYSTNYAKAKPQRSCVADSEANTFAYGQQSVLLSGTGSRAVRVVLGKVHAAITGADHRPIYLHCWNGWHASGYISALVLRQFCGTGPAEAVAYWDRNADHPEHYQAIRERVRAFTPLPEFQIDENQKRLVCPRLTL